MVEYAAKGIVLFMMSENDEEADIISHFDEKIPALLDVSSNHYKLNLVKRKMITKSPPTCLISNQVKVSEIEFETLKSSPREDQVKNDQILDAPRKLSTQGLIRPGLNPMMGMGVSLGDLKSALKKRSDNPVHLDLEKAAEVSNTDNIEPSFKINAKSYLEKRIHIKETSPHEIPAFQIPILRPKLNHFNKIDADETDDKITLVKLRKLDQSSNTNESVSPIQAKVLPVSVIKQNPPFENIPNIKISPEKATVELPTVTPKSRIRFDNLRLPLVHSDTAPVPDKTLGQDIFRVKLRKINQSANNTPLIQQKSDNMPSELVISNSQTLTEDTYVKEKNKINKIIKSNEQKEKPAEIKTNVKTVMESLDIPNISTVFSQSNSESTPKKRLSYSRNKVLKQVPIAVSPQLKDKINFFDDNIPKIPLNKDINENRTEKTKHTIQFSHELPYKSINFKTVPDKLSKQVDPNELNDSVYQSNPLLNTNDQGALKNNPVFKNNPFVNINIANKSQPTVLKATNNSIKSYKFASIALDPRFRKYGENRIKISEDNLKFVVNKPPYIKTKLIKSINDVSTSTNNLPIKSSQVKSYIERELLPRTISLKASSLTDSSLQPCSTPNRASNNENTKMASPSESLTLSAKPILISSNIFFRTSQTPLSNEWPVKTRPHSIQEIEKPVSHINSSYHNLSTTDSVPQSSFTNTVPLTKNRTSNKVFFSSMNRSATVDNEKAPLSQKSSIIRSSTTSECETPQIIKQLRKDRMVTTVNSSTLFCSRSTSKNPQTNINDSSTRSSIPTEKATLVEDNNSLLSTNKESITPQEFSHKPKQDNSNFPSHTVNIPAETMLVLTETTITPTETNTIPVETTSIPAATTNVSTETTAIPIEVTTAVTETSNISTETTRTAQNVDINIKSPISCESSVGDESVNSDSSLKSKPIVQAADYVTPNQLTSSVVCMGKEQRNRWDSAYNSGTFMKQQSGRSSSDEPPDASNLYKQIRSQLKHIPVSYSEPSRKRFSTVNSDPFLTTILKSLRPIAQNYKPSTRLIFSH